MKQVYKVVIGASFILLFPLSSVFSQAFNKGTLLISISEGATYTKYTTVGSNQGVIKQGNINGDRDPLTIEYGITDKWGVGLNMGGDLLNVNPSAYYNFSTPSNRVKAIMSEFTFDGHYHYFVTKRTDLSFFASVGLSSVTLKGNEGDHAYQYNAAGGIIRAGAQARYYITNRFGVHGMVSAYSVSTSSDGIAGNTVGNNVSTSIKGIAWEVGLCVRLLKGHPATQPASAVHANIPMESRGAGSK